MSHANNDEQEALGTSIVFFSVCLVMSHLWRRLHLTYCQWPWRLAALVDPRLDGNEREEIGKSFFRAKNRCLDRGCSRPLQSILETDTSLQDRYISVARSISVQKVTNSQIENNFARAASASRCARGTLA